MNSALMGTALLILVLYIFKMPHMSRVVVFGFVAIDVLLMFVKEMIVREYLTRLRKEKKGVRNVVILGDTLQLKRLNDLIKKNPYLGLDVIGYISFEEEARHKMGDGGLRDFGKVERLKYVLHTHPVDILLIGLPRERHAEIEELLFICEEEGVDVWVAADIFRASIAKTSVDVLEGMPILIFKTTPEISWQLFFKRVADIAMSAIALILLSPVFLIVTLAIRLTSPGPAVFKQKRIGLHGRKFIMYKFRSMETNAEQRREELKRLNIMKGPVFKARRDPRITKIGRFLRKTSLDELPQMWNVLIGEMSLVGPRPPLPTEVEMYKGWQRRRLSMKPGITCLWQISGRNKIKSFDKWAELDLKYIDNWSFWLDIKILLKTIPVVLSGFGAE
jgi:exopolysaccharide biosynthesis polyprenyl glycosylphosphotransferase